MHGDARRGSDGTVVACPLKGRSHVSLGQVAGRTKLAARRHLHGLAIREFAAVREHLDELLVLAAQDLNDLRWIGDRKAIEADLLEHLFLRLCRRKRLHLVGGLGGRSDDRSRATLSFLG